MNEARKPRRQFQVNVNSLWQPDDWQTGASFSVGGTGPGKAALQRILRDLTPRPKGKKKMNNESAAEVVIARVMNGELIEDVVAEMTHWPAVPTYRVVPKPKPAPQPKPQVSPSAHASMPKSWGK